jgi:asparagine synthase (glutamine-hydrolysing)
MCGITGFLDSFCSMTREDMESITRSMSRALSHRGPDDGGTWLDMSAGISLGHRRLSVLDLSQAGRQPMHSTCRRYTISFNGEIYNFRSLRETLKSSGHLFHTTSDTEVLLAAISEWGIEDALPRFNGMFAFALWDRQAHYLSLARDRLGEKPLYYGRFDRSLVFASELKSLIEHPHFRATIDRDVLALVTRRPLCQNA